MSLIIDGHNLIGALPGVRLGDPDDEALLISRLRSYRAKYGQEMIVFFDSGDLPASVPDLSSAGLQVRFAQPGQTADDAIVDFLRGRAEPGQYAVVTNDQELSYRVRAVGASVLAASRFAERLARPRRRSGGPAPERGPDPRDPAFADLYADFLYGAAEEARFGKDLRAPVEVWLERLYGDDADQARLAAEWLGRRGGEQALAPLQDAITHEDSHVRAAALLALGQLGDPAALSALLARLANDPSGLAREAAAESLGRFSGSAVESALQAAAAGDAKAKVRRAARVALAQVRARRPGG
jgi:uncharacterized protein